MKKVFSGFSIAVLLSCVFAIQCTSVQNRYDVVIVGGGTSGTAAAIQAARSGADVLLVEEYEWLGGMLTSAGVSATDGSYKLRGGIWDEFRDSLEAHYGNADSLKTGWVSNVMFEPSVGNRIFQNMVSREKGLSVLYNTTASEFERTEDGWKIRLDGAKGQKYAYAEILVDATELGDVAKEIGIRYDLGMDSAAETGESIAPVEKNNIVQDMTYVMILKDYGHPVPIPEPDGYEVSEFACCCTNPLCKHPKEAYRMWKKDDMITYGKLPNGKYMINWPLEGNDFYSNVIEMSSEERAEAFDQAKQKSLRFLYFMQNELGFVNLGLADDEYPTADAMPFIPYHRESRRIEGLVRFNVNDINRPYDQSKKLYRTGIAVGDYPVDQHHTQYHGWESLPNLYFHPIPSYSLPIGVMMPRQYDDVLVIEKSVSVTNIANGTTRLQPVVLQLGQAAGVVAALAAKYDCPVSEVSVREVQNELLEAGAYLVPLLDLPASDPYFKTLQKIALTGIIRYVGTNLEWENQSWFYPEKLMLAEELLSGMKSFYSGLKRADGSAVFFDGISIRKEVADVAFLASVISAVDGRNDAQSDVIACLAGAFGKEYAPASPLTRLECAVALERILNPFGSYDVDVYGNLRKMPERLMWVDLSANWERFTCLDSIRIYCEKVAKTGMTSIVLDVKGTGSDVPYASRFTPQLREWKGIPAPDFDYIGEFSKAARENGLKIYCSVNTFAEGHGVFKKGLIYDGHPEWQAVNYVPGEGLKKQLDIKGKQVLFTNPAIPEVREHMCNILGELVSGFDIDGVILDRGRYDNIQSDFSDYSRSLFEKYIGEKVERFPEDIYEWVKNPESGRYEIKRGKWFLEWIEWRVSVIYTFFEEARAAVKKSNPDAAFGAYTGAWYPSYYEVGVNWASRNYDPSEDFDWASEDYGKYGYAELLDIYTNGNYYPLVTLEEFRKSNGTYRNETDSGISSGEHLCVEGACLYSRKLLGSNPFCGGMYVQDYSGNPDQFIKAVKMNMDKSDGLMIFDIVHIINFGWWDELAKALQVE